MQSKTGNNETRGQKIILCFYLIFIFVATAHYEYQLRLQPAEMSVEDWLINYRAGFIRRGITGEMAILLPRLFHTPPAYFVVLFQLACYSILLLAAYLLLRRHSEWSVWTWALVVSPATFGFQLVDHVGGFRKEILFFAGLSVLLLMLKRSVSSWKILAFLSLWLPFTTLAHESNFFYTPYYAAAILLAGKSFGELIKLFLPPLTLSVVAMFLVSTHPGNSQMAKIIFDSVHLAPPTSGVAAIQFLGDTRSQAHADLLIALHRDPYWRIYGITGTLAILPIVWMVVPALRSNEHRFAGQVIVAAAMSTLLLSLSLYFYALDWGRWIYMHVLAISLLLFFLDWDHAGLHFWGRRILQEAGLGRRLACIALFFYAVSWTLPHVPFYGQYFGYVQRFAHAKMIVSHLR